MSAENPIQQVMVKYGVDAATARHMLALAAEDGKVTSPDEFREEQRGSAPVEDEE